MQRSNRLEKFSERKLVSESALGDQDVLLDIVQWKPKVDV